MDKSHNSSFQNAGMNIAGLNRSGREQTPKQPQPYGNYTTTNGDYQDKFLITELAGGQPAYENPYQVMVTPLILSLLITNYLKYTHFIFLLLYLRKDLRQMKATGLTVVLMIIKSSTFRMLSHLQISMLLILSFHLMQS